MIRALIYDTIFGIPTAVATPVLYRTFLNHVPPGSKILEIGIGTGITLWSNADIIKEKQLQILGVDIDKSYASLCTLRIQRKNLEDLVQVKVCNILELQLQTESYDYILFLESYPVIDKAIMDLIIDKLRYIVKPTGKICFVHNLVEQEEWTITKAAIKSNLYKFTTVEFGKLIIRSKFEKWCHEKGLKLDFMQVIGEINPPIPMFNSIRQYMYFWKPGL